MTIDRAPKINEILYGWGLMSTISARNDAANDFGLYEIYRTVPKDMLGESWIVTEKLLLEIKRLAEAHGAGLAVVVVPAPWEVYPKIWEAILSKIPAMRQVPLDLDQPSRRLTSFLQANEIKYVDLLPGFRAHGARRTLFFESDNHWTADGHGLAVNLIIDSVVSMLGVNESSATTKVQSRLTSNR
jgi:hypothetical protein